MGTQFLGCSAPNPKNSQQRRRLGVSIAQLTDVEKRMLRLQKLVAAHANTASEEVVRRRAQLFRNAIRSVELGSEVILNPSSGRSGADFAARQLAMNRHAAGLAEDYTDPGWLRESMNRVKRQWRGGIQKTIRDLGIYEVFERASRDIEPIMKKYNFNDADKAEIIATAQEVGWLPYMRQLTDVNPLAVADLQQQFTDFADELVKRFGMSAQDASFVLKIGGDVAQQYHVLEKVATEAGANFNKLDTQGYFARMLTKSSADRFNWRMKKEPGGGELFEFNTGEISTAGAVINRSRATHRFLVDDEAIMDYVIRNVSSQKYKDPEEIYRLALGLTPAEAKAAGGVFIGRVLDSSKALNHLIAGELSDNVIESLVEAGVLLKAQRQTRQVAEHMIRTYQLPVEGLNELFITDFKQGLSAYTKQLEAITETSGWTSLFFGNIIKENWGVNPAKFNENPKLYKDYVRLVDADNGVLTPEMAERLGLTDPVLSGMPDNWRMIREYRVHPTAANIMRASLETQTSPGAMAAMGEMLQWLTRNFQQWATVTEGFVPRQFVNSFFQVAAGGGNIMGMVTNAPLIVHHYIQGKPLADAFDNVKRVYENGTMTARDVVQRMIDNGFISDYEPLSAERLSKTGRGTGTSDLAQLAVTGDVAKAHQTLARNVRWAMYAAKEYKDVGRVLQEAGSVAGFVTSPLIRAFQIGNNAADVVGRVTAVLSTMRRADSALPEPVHYMRSVSGNGRRFNTVDDAVAHWQNYFYFYDDTSKLDAVARSLIPFWGFHSKNLPAAVRHAIRHPSRYAAFNRVVAWSNRSQMLGTDEVNEGTVPEWAIHTVPIFFRVPGLNKDGSDSWFHIGLSNLDPFSGAYNDFIGAPAESVLEALGIWQDDATADEGGYRRTRGGTQSRLDSSPIGTNTQNSFLEQLSEKLFPHMQAAAQIVSAGVNSASGREETDRSINTFLGVEMSPLLETLISSVLPLAATVNRMNPGQQFGVKGYYDQATETVVPDQLSWAGNIRTDNDAFSRSNLPGSDMLNAVAGIRAQPLNVLANAGTTMTDMRITVRESAKVYRQARQRAMELPPGSRQRQEAFDRLPALYAMSTALVEDLSKFEAWAENRGMDLEAAREALMKQRQSLSGLPDERTPAQMAEYEREIQQMNGVPGLGTETLQGTVETFQGDVQRFNANGLEIE